MSPLGDVDDWYLELVTHEYTHVLHTDHIRGLPALVNAVLGKTLAPNQVQPRWILEGLGVYQESARTSAGRLRNSQWDMFMRADVLDDNVASLDQLSNIVRRWPQGNLYYLYGSYFTRVDRRDVRRRRAPQDGGATTAGSSSRGASTDRSVARPARRTSTCTRCGSRA